MTEFQEMAKSGDWEANGWPNCAYTVSKVGVNVYTRILQRQFVEEGSGNVVNSIHPGTKHSKIQQQSVIPLEDGAWAIANCACIPDTKGSLRGEVRCCLYFRVFTNTKLLSLLFADFVAQPHAYQMGGGSDKAKPP